MHVTSRKQTNIACYWVSTPCSVKCSCKHVLQTECSVKLVVICDCTTDLFRRVPITVSSTGNMHAQHKEMHMITRFPGVHMWVYINTNVNTKYCTKNCGCHHVTWCSHVGLHKYTCQHSTEKFVQAMQVTSRKQTNIACYWVSPPCSVKCCYYIINTCMWHATSQGSQILCIRMLPQLHHRCIQVLFDTGNFQSWSACIAFNPCMRAHIRCWQQMNIYTTKSLPVHQSIYGHVCTCQHLCLRPFN